MKEPLYGKTLSELTEIVQAAKLPKFTAKQICDWLYKKNASEIDQMTNLSKAARSALSEAFCVGRQAPLTVAESIDGSKKYLFQTANGPVETAYIPDADRATLCVSSQVGCKMHCLFCMTGRQGFAGNLTAGEILNQMASIGEREQLTNMVYMGMGEPLDNLDNVLRSIEILTSDWGYAWSPRRITVSTIGITSRLADFLDKCQAHLAISLHNPNSAERLEIMPAEKAFPIKESIALLRKYNWSGQRRLSFEYTVFEGVNDSAAHASAIVALVRGLHCRVNLIRFNAIPDCQLKGASQQRMEKFRDMLNAKGLTATIRLSKGSDIDAACGMLSTKEKAK